MYDSFGRLIRYLRISVTDRCNQRCVYCMPPEGIPLIPHSDVLSFESIAAVAAAAYRKGIGKIRFTGGEPLVRKGFPELVSLVRAAAPDALLAMTTNGTLLAPLAADLRRRGLESVNISLDSLDPDRYAAITRGGVLADAVAGIEAALSAGLRVKLNAVVAADIQEDDPGLVALMRFAEDRGAAFQRIRQYRLDEPKEDDLRFERPPPCAACDRIRLSADGYLQPCLHSDIRVKVDFGSIEASLDQCVRAKPERGFIRSIHAVNTIGG